MDIRGKQLSYDHTENNFKSSIFLDMMVTWKIDVSGHQPLEQRHLQTELARNRGSDDRTELFWITGENELATWRQESFKKA